MPLIILNDFTLIHMKTPMQELICNLAQKQDNSPSAEEKKFLDKLIDIAIDLQREEKQSIITAFNDGQNHGMYDAVLPLGAGAIYYNRKYIKTNNKK